jgi:hypothetical protein
MNTETNGKRTDCFIRVVSLPARRAFRQAGVFLIVFSVFHQPMKVTTWHIGIRHCFLDQE